MRISFREADWEAIARLWAEFYPERYRVDPHLLKLNTVECPVFDWGASAIEVVDEETLGFVVVKRPSNPSLWAGPNQDTYHISAIAYREPETGIDLMAQAKRIVSNRGGLRLLYGMDSQHFFPGCPEDCQRTCSFLMVEGFERSGGHFDLERDMGDYEMPVAPLSGIDYRGIRDSEIPALETFLDREFPGRWKHDTMAKVKADGAEQTAFGCFEDGRLLGFAVIQDWSHNRPIGGAVWHLSMGDRWGALGPIGVAKEHRGRGLGHSLLGSALADLKRRGVDRCIIDWTGLEDFYGRHGFKISRRYQTASLKLD